MSVVLAVGHKLNMSLSFLDQNGNPMLVDPTPDSPPTWTDSTSATETLSAASNGLSCVATPIAVGTDVVTVDVVVGGVTLAATLDVTVSAEPQVLTSIVIDSTVS